MTQTISPLALMGAPNFRDLGGYRTADGRTVRRGQIFRSEGFADLTDADMATAGRLGARLRCDLRSDGERERVGTRWPDPDPDAVLLLDVGSDPRAANRAFFAALEADFGPGGAYKAMLALQRLMPRTFHGKLSQFFERILDQGRLPAVFHCHYGKDRTGFMAAIILLAVGVPLETVYQDYMRTAEFYKPERAADSMAGVIEIYMGRRPDTETVWPLVTVNLDYLKAGLEEVQTAYGSIDNYLLRAGGLDAARRARLCELLFD